VGVWEANLQPFFSEQDDRPHQPDGHPLWQESSLFVWRDRASGVSGFWRLGQEPVAGAVNSCFGVFTDDGLRFRSNASGAPLGPDDRGEAHMGFGSHLKVEFDGSAKITADFADCEAQLRFDDFHPRFDYHAIAMPGLHLSGAANHFEVSGRMTGRIRIGEREVEIDALGYRDRSWSQRDWSKIRATRWWPCVFGPDLTTHLIHLVNDGGELVKVGYVWRDGTTIAIVDSDLAIALESDAMTPRWAEAVLHLANGETLKVRGERTDGVVMHVRGYTAVEAIGTAFLDGREGMSNIEVCSNAARGQRPPVFALGSNMTDGLSFRK